LDDPIVTTNGIITPNLREASTRGLTGTITTTNQAEIKSQVEITTIQVEIIKTTSKAEITTSEAEITTSQAETTTKSTNRSHPRFLSSCPFRHKNTRRSKEFLFP